MGFIRQVDVMEVTPTCVCPSVCVLCGCVIVTVVTMSFWASLVRADMKSLGSRSVFLFFCVRIYPVCECRR